MDPKSVETPSPNLTVDVPQVDPRAEMTRISRRSFMWAAGAMATAYGAFTFIDRMSKVDDQPWLLRKSFEANEQLWRKLEDPHKLARTFSKSDISTDDKVNGEEGLAEVDVEDWRLVVEGAGKSHIVTLAQIMAMPTYEMITEFNCIEGWTRVIHWKGIRFKDLLVSLGIDITKLPTYVALETPMRGYYVGHHSDSCLHPQSLLAFEMNGEPLTDGHGAPLRHVLPTKYGYKQIKHLGLIKFTEDRPADYWVEAGYDWYGAF